MTTPETAIADHYGTPGLYDRILDALSKNGIERGDITTELLKSVDEFHIGGAAATARLLDPLNIPAGATVLDIGCGIGGPARYLTARYDVAVTGLDLTPEYVETARRLTEDVGMEVTYHVGSALDMPFGDHAFDYATLLHVGMNLPDKVALFAEAARVLKPGGTFAVYDVMLFGDHPDFPLPWAGDAGCSFLQEPDVYLSAAAAAGFTLLQRNERGDVARTFFAEMQARMASNGPPVLGPPLLMGETAPIKVANMIAGVNAGHIAPVEMIFQSAA